MQEIPYLFAFAQVLVAVSQTQGRYGTTRTPRKFWSLWEEERISEGERNAIKNRRLGEEQVAELLQTVHRGSAPILRISGPGRFCPRSRTSC